jgi:hypothetical protein
VRHGYAAGVRLAAVTLAGVCAVALSACGNTVQSSPISHSLLEDLIVAPYPVYWLGDKFEGMKITEATHDPSGAFSVEYGNCLQGGQGACVPPLRIVSSPDNSFLPGGLAPATQRTVRGAMAVIAQQGRTMVIATGGVVVDIYGDEAQLASAAAKTMVPINEIGSPEEPLPARLPDTGFAATPLASQMPSPLKPLR